MVGGDHSAFCDNKALPVDPPHLAKQLFQHSLGGLMVLAAHEKSPSTSIPVDMMRSTPSILIARCAIRPIAWRVRVPFIAISF
jgi:hypothetical protein